MTHPLGVGNTSHAHPYYDMHLWRCLTHQMLASGVGTHARVCEHVQKKAQSLSRQLCERWRHLHAL
eukprot:CAMPEP_0184379026 /NCGR_PEP_ID=MMETSP0007-20130409/3512_1 /TAXON_ID=97485 /ORGANISM="Prymnesium parvum, Strain Texoma1" /LENGTH=65 /DNA_ID=CAMNT_0026723509 /DNA_START=67 /DNA_END=264 /DNA_ORIENTATION=-